MRVPKQSELVPASGLATLTSAGLLQIVAVSVLALSFILEPGLLPELNLCLFNAATGMQCPGCGMTRAFCAISHGQFAQAWHLNPFSFHFYALAVLGLAYPIFANAISERLLRAVILVTTVALTVFGVCRIFCAL